MIFVTWQLSLTFFISKSTHVRTDSPSLCRLPTLQDASIDLGDASRHGFIFPGV